MLHAPPISTALFHHFNNIWYRAQLTKLLIMQSSPFPYYFVPHRPNYESSSIPYSRKHSTYAYPTRWGSKSNTHTKNRQNYSSVYLNFCTLGLQTGRQRFYIIWEKAFPDFSLLLIPSWMEYWFVKIFSICLKCFTLSNDLFPISMLWFCPACWSRDMTIDLVLSTFTYSPTFLLAPSEVLCSFYSTGIFTQKSSAETKNWCIPFSFSPYLYSLTLIRHSRKINHKTNPNTITKKATSKFVSYI